MLVLVLLSNTAFSADVHKWRDENGVLHFSDRPPANIQSEVVSIQPNVYATPTVEELEIAFSTEGKVTMYSAVWCGYCKKAREYFVANNVPFQEYDVETSRKGRQDYKRLNAKSVPIILIGRQRLNGFSAKRFESIYNK